jgi:spore coat protein CotH
VFKKTNTLLTIIIFIALALAVFLWIIFRPSLNIGKSTAAIDETSKTIIVNLDSNSSSIQKISFNQPGCSLYIEPLSYGNKMENSPVQIKLEDGATYDFKSYIFHGKLLKKQTGKTTTYDLWITTGDIPILRLDTTDKDGQVQAIPGKSSPTTELEASLGIFYSGKNTFSGTFDKASQDIKINIKALGKSGASKARYSFDMVTSARKIFKAEILDFGDSKAFKLDPLDNDPSLMRLKMSYDIFNMLGDATHKDIAPKSAFVELYLNDSYQGVYCIEERVNKKLLKLSDYNKNDNSHSAIYEAKETGADLTNGISGFIQNEPEPVSEATYPDPLANFSSFVSTASKEDFDSKISNYLSIDSAIDNEILYLVCANQNTMALNQYLYLNNHANDGGRFSFCPGDYYISSFGIDTFSNKMTSEKVMNQSPLYSRLFDNTSFETSLKERYNYLRKYILTTDNINSLIDNNYLLLKSAWYRNFESYPEEDRPVSFEDEISYMKKFLLDRLIYLDGRINNPPTITIGNTPAKIYDHANTIFCKLPADSSSLQLVNFDFGPDAKVYIRARSYGITNIYDASSYYNDFIKYKGIISQIKKTDLIKNNIDTPAYNNEVMDNVSIRGWALDLNSKTDPGIESIFVFDGPSVNQDAYLGKARAGFSRKDVADFFNNPSYENSGFQFEFNSLNLTNGIHDLYVYTFNKNNNYSVNILKVTVDNYKNIPTKLEDADARQQILNSQEFNFKDFIYHGDLIVEKSGTSETYDIWVTTGDLPIVYINTGNENINNIEKINGSIKVIDNNSCEMYENIGIEIRGSSAQSFPEKQYSLELYNSLGEEKEVPLLGLPEESDWVLYAPYTDKSLMRNVLAYQLSSKMGLYAPRTKFFELFLDEGYSQVIEKGYIGLYVLIEKIKRDNNRINIKENDPIAAVKGQTGFILEMTTGARIRQEDVTIKTKRGADFFFIYPRQKYLTYGQKEWVLNYMNEFEDTLYGPDFKDPVNGYRKYIDVDSFIDYILITEFFKNIDTFYYSTFINMDPGGKLKIGPVWDFDQSSGNNKIRDIDDWFYLNKRWTDRLFKDDYFISRYIARWKELRKNVLMNESISDLINMNEKTITEDGASRNFNKWQILGVSIYPYSEPIPESYMDEIVSLKEWLLHRADWMDKNIDSLLNRD